MGKLPNQIDPGLDAFIRAQKMFFVATAPLDGAGHVNLSPKGLDTLRILDPHTVAYLDHVGSGAETIAHLRENGRIVLMMCAFQGAPRIVRIHGRGSVFEPHGDDYARLRALFPAEPGGGRSIVRIAIDRISDSCGYGVPLYAFERDRSQLPDWAARKGPQGLQDYQAQKNRVSIDGLPALKGPETTTGRTLFPMDYDAYAKTYAWSRSAVPWVLQPLLRASSTLTAGASILEVGCGTGNYIRALAESRSDLVHFGFDRSEPMLSEARQLRGGNSVTFLHGDASTRFPFPDATFAFAYAVDVIHHIEDLFRFFQEAHRVLAPGGSLAIVTDSENTLRRRSLTRFFPEILSIELARYPSVPLLHDRAKQAGLRLVSEEMVTGTVDLDEDFLARLEARCSSAMRLMEPVAHAEGMARVRAAGAKGERWSSFYDVLLYRRPQ